MERQHNVARQAPVWVSILVVTLIVGAVGAALATIQRLPNQSTGASGKGALGRESIKDINYFVGLTQPDDTSYSPDGSHIAMLGVYTPCAPTPHQLSPCGHGLAILNSVTGDLERLSPIESLLGLSRAGAAQNGPFLYLDGVGWTPDSAWYGMIYSVFGDPIPSSPDDLQDSGLLLINPATGGSALVRGDSGYFSTLGGLVADHPIWDTTRQTQLPAAPLIPSLLYSWTNSSAPQAMEPPHTPITHLPANVGAFAPVGNPDGGSPFTVWQPGVLIGPGSAGLSGQRGAFVTTFPAWSSVGQRVGVFTAGVSLPVPPRAFGIASAPASVGAPHVPYPDTLLEIPPRDLALTAVQNEIGAYGWAQVAWSPDGSKLASINCYARQGASLEIRDTLSGKVIGSANLTLSQRDPGCRDLAQVAEMDAYPTSNLTIAWAPDGHQLILADRAAATLTMWQVLSNH